MKKCTQCGQEIKNKPNGIMCLRCETLYDMSNAWMAFCGNPRYLAQNIQTISHCMTIDDIRRLASHREADQLMALANKLETYQRRGKSGNLIPDFIAREQIRAKQIKTKHENAA